MKLITLTAAAAGTAAALLAITPASLAIAMPPAGTASLNPATIQYVGTTLHGTPGGTVLGTVACPAGTFVVSSAAAGNADIGSITPLRGARTSDSISNFTAVGATAKFNPTIPASSATLGIVAGCAPAAQLAGATSKTLQVVTSVGGVREGVIRCPSGTRAFGGGGHFVTPDNHYSTAGVMYSNSVTADGTGWTYRGWTNSVNDRLQVTTSCAPLPGSYIASKKVAFTNQGNEAFAQCFTGYNALSGGVQMLRSDGTTGSDVGGSIQYSWPTSNGWYVSGYSGGYPNLVLNALAQCIPTT